MVPERVRAVGYGASRPLATNATPEGRSQNRRVEVVNLGAWTVMHLVPPPGCLHATHHAPGRGPGAWSCFVPLERKSDTVRFFSLARLYGLDHGVGHPIVEVITICGILCLPSEGALLMAHVQFTDVQDRPTECLDLTSLTLDEFQQLVPPFEAAFQAHMATWRLDGKPRTARRFSVYQSCPLPTPEDRLLFLLAYIKTYSLQVIVPAQILLMEHRRCGYTGSP